MPLLADTAIVTAAEVSNISNEASLTAADSGEASLAQLLPEGTNAIRRVLRKRGNNPDDVTNEDDFKHAAAWWILWTYFDGLASTPGAREKADRYEQKWLKTMAETEAIQGAGDSVAGAGTIGPVVMNQDSEPVFARGRNTRGIPGARRVRRYRSD